MDFCNRHRHLLVTDTCCVCSIDNCTILKPVSSHHIRDIVSMLRTSLMLVSICLEWCYHTYILKSVYNHLESRNIWYLHYSLHKALRCVYMYKYINFLSADSSLEYTYTPNMHWYTIKCIMHFVGWSVVSRTVKAPTAFRTFSINVMEK